MLQLFVKLVLVDVIMAISSRSSQRTSKGNSTRTGAINCETEIHVPSSLPLPFP